MKFSALLTILAASLATYAQADVLYISQSNGELYAPGFRGEVNTSYYGWSTGTFDSNPTVESGEFSMTRMAPLRAWARFLAVLERIL